jgi:hypothetical protein
LRADNLSDAPIIKTTIDLYKTYYQYLELFPKKDKYTIGATCERYIIKILETLITASHLPKEQKLPLIYTANDRFEILKVFIRLLRELNIIDEKKRVNLQSIIQDIGRQFGGWIKNLNDSQNNPASLKN